MFRLRIRARDLAHADGLADALAACLDPETATVGTVDTGAGWLAEAFYVDEPDACAVWAHLDRMLEEPAADLRLDIEPLADRDWVRESLEAMPPVAAGRFVVFGHHDRARVPVNATGIEIEAGLAFGTGHHATTLGCLFALDRLAKQRRFRRPLDVGTGTGVLAIAAAKSFRVRVLATDIDPVAVDTTRENAGKNGVGNLVHATVADGVGQPRVSAEAPYDLIMANILARPLVTLAPHVARIAARRANVILSGLLNAQQREVEAVWRGQGFALVSRLSIDGWATLVLAKR